MLKRPYQTKKIEATQNNNIVKVNSDTIKHINSFKFEESDYELSSSNNKKIKTNQFSHST